MLRRKVVERDGERCAVPGRDRLDDLHLDHVWRGSLLEAIRWSPSAINDPINLLLLCPVHHADKTAHEAQLLRTVVAFVTNDSAARVGGRLVISEAGVQCWPHPGRLELSGQRILERLPARSVAELAARCSHSTVRSMPPLSSRAGIGSERRVVVDRGRSRRSGSASDTARRKRSARPPRGQRGALVDDARVSSGSAAHGRGRRRGRPGHGRVPYQRLPQFEAWPRGPSPQRAFATRQVDRPRRPTNDRRCAGGQVMDAGVGLSGIRPIVPASSWVNDTLCAAPRRAVGREWRFTRS